MNLQLEAAPARIGGNYSGGPMALHSPPNSGRLMFWKNLVSGAWALYYGVY